MSHPILPTLRLQALRMYLPPPGLAEHLSDPYYVGRYNDLPGDHDQPNFPAYHLNRLALVFVRYKVQDIFGLHLIHGHFKIPQDTFMLGSSIRGRLTGYWTKPTPFETASSPIHGHIYILSSDNRPVAYEYREGDSPAAKTNPAFFRELFEYLSTNQLTGLLGLEVLEDTSNGQVFEFVIAGEGTVMVKEEQVAHADPYRVTGWSFAEDHGIISVKGHETHASLPNGPHHIFRDGKPLRSIDTVVELLLQKQVIKERYGS